MQLQTNAILFLNTHILNLSELICDRLIIGQDQIRMTQKTSSFHPKKIESQKNCFKTIQFQNLIEHCFCLFGVYKMKNKIEMETIDLQIVCKSASFAIGFHGLTQSFFSLSLSVFKVKVVYSSWPNWKRILFPKIEFLSYFELPKKLEIY